MNPAPGIRLGALALVGALVVGACSTNAGTSPSTGTGTTHPASGAAGSALPQPPTAEVTLQGAGATFPAPLYQVWFETYGEQHPNVRIDYQAIGSGGGIKAITEGTVDFGASDAPMKDDEIAKLPPGRSILHVPTALGAVVVIVNLPGVDSVQLDGQNVADLFLGTIRKWNDPKIAANNPGVTLPDRDVVVVHRSDGSGTTNAFTTYLAAVSDAWKNGPGTGKEVAWPTGIGAQGNDGVAGGVKQSEGAVGYVELNYAEQAKLTSAKLKNADGAFVAGSTAGVTAAAEAAAADFPADLRQAPIINGPGAETYPIASYTYLLLDTEMRDADKAAALVAFVAWAITDGQSAEGELGYAPLPKAVQEKALAELHRITASGSPVWP